MLYEMKPTICVAAGALCEFALEPVAGKMAALLLILAGLVVFNLRLAYRRNKQ